MIKIVAGTGVVFVGRGRKDQYEDVKEVFSEMGADVRYVPGPKKLAPILLDFHECRKVLVFTDTENVAEVREVVGKSQGVEVSDEYDL
ncbi:MAG: hypothetical protein M1352_01605 [Patescibacteria group bacterium]|nr:hypothetical protein [Patescibacteria group bacterium]